MVQLTTYLLRSATRLFLARKECRNEYALYRRSSLCNAPTVTGPTDGEGGSASGIWSLETQSQYAGASGWPLPTVLRQLWTWGFGGYGQLGDGGDVNKSSPVQVGALNTWKDVSCGKHFKVGLQEGKLTHLVEILGETLGLEIQLPILLLYRSVR